MSTPIEVVSKYFPIKEPDIYEEGTYIENCEGEKMTLANYYVICSSNSCR